MKLDRVFCCAVEATESRALEEEVVKLFADEFAWKNIEHLSKVDDKFPFDFYGEDETGKKWFIDVTIRIGKPVRSKNVRFWKSQDYHCGILVYSRELANLYLYELEEDDVGFFSTTMFQLRATDPLRDKIFSEQQQGRLSS